MKKYTPLVLIASIIVLLALGKIFIFKKPEEKGSNMPKNTEKGKGEKPAMPPVGVSVYVAQSEALNNIFYASGTIMPNEEAELHAETSGRLVALHIKEGSSVGKGQLIAKINDADLQAQIKKNEFEIGLAKQIEARQKKLLDINAISKDEYEISATKINTLAADNELLKAQLTKTLVHAPFAGKISFKNVSLGAYVTPATNIATIVQTNPVKVDFALPEKYAQQIRVGRSISFEEESSNGNYAGTVTALDPKIDINTRTLRVRAVANNNSGKLIPGAFVRVSAELTNLGNAVMIPTEAIIPILKGKKVYVVAGGKAKEVLVETGLRTDQKVQVTNGLSVGDSVIVSGLMSLKDGGEVKVKKK